MRRTRRSLWTLCCLATLIAVGGIAGADDVADFYKRTNVSLVIGFSAGGGYDAYARLLARFLSKHLPGGPTVVPQQMAGAGSLRAANYIYTVAPKDGSIFGTFSRSISISPLVDKAQFDSRKFTWLGSVTDDNTICVSSSASPVKNWDDFINTPSKFGGEGVGGEPDSWLSMYRNVFGAKAQLVTGYPGTNDIVLAMERGEVDGLCGLSWSTIKTQHPQWLTGHLVNFIVQAALQKEPALPSTPLATDLAKTPEQLQILKLMLVTEAMARPFAAPPETPPDRKAALLSAFDGTVNDPDFLAEAQKLNFDVRPVSAAKIDALLADVYSTPKEVIDRAKKAIASEGQ
ncbi:MAG: tripartite tricarboxylate transporter substrate-binding protein [Xanthobacteraceae bacterium]|jgi:tripartite-type tricarboxylate transporter receptor subunit TctC